ncbi:MAG: hypothetical protein GY767_22630 [Shimia sp.]|nr:hypothetical protein [Shimia sp.]
MPQQGDVVLFQTDDGGEITITGGVVTMDGGLRTAAYLSLFGGNGWWGNTTEVEPEKRYECETEALLKSLPLTSGNLIRVEDAVARDLAWLSQSVAVSASIPALNRLQIDVTINGNEKFEFIANWGPR